MERRASTECHITIEAQGIERATEHHVGTEASRAVELGVRMTGLREAVGS